MGYYSTCGLRLVILSLITQLQHGDGQRAYLRGKPTKQPAGCAKTEFTCGDKKCIPLSAVCNGTAECIDGRDEGTEHCTIIKTGVCTSPSPTKNFCDGSFDAPDDQNITHQFLCQSETLRKDGSVPLTCSNGAWTPVTTLCTRVCQPIVLRTANVTCVRNGKKVNCSQPLLTGTKLYPKCEFYYRPSYKEIVCHANGEWSQDNVNCIPECGRQFKEKMRYTKSIRSTEFREFPWSVSIYYTKPGATAATLIPGTIITPYLVVTTAINFYVHHRRGILNVDSIAVAVAKRTKEAEVIDDLFQKTYKVRDIHFTETGYQNYDLSLTSENIAVIELSEKIVLSPSVYPACVNWGNNSALIAEEATIGQVPHTLSILEANASAVQVHEILQTIAVRFVSHDACVNTDAVKNMPYAVKVDNFCTEPILAPAPCDGSFIFLEPTTNLFYVQGLVDGVTPSTDDPPTFMNTFIDLAVHMDWINFIRKRHEDRLVANEVRIQANAEAPAAICRANITNRDVGSVGLRSGFSDGDAQANSVKGCQLPAKTAMNAADYTVSCASNVPESECRRVGDIATAPEYTSLKLNCRSGFVLDTTAEVVCFKGKWNPSLTPCRKFCDKLPKLANGKVTCYEEGKRVNCSSTLKAKAKAVLECEPAYRFEREAATREIECKDDGSWSARPSTCIKKMNNSSTLPKSIPKTLRSDFNSSSTSTEGHTTNCTKEEFACGSKLCIPKSAVCNGSIECSDGKDEDSKYCKIISTGPCSAASQTLNYCVSELSTEKRTPAERKYSFLCNAEFVNNKEGLPLTCVKGIWTPSTQPCTRVCQNITLTVSGLECLRNGRRQNCKLPLLVGTKIIPHCEKDYKPNHAEVTCNANGEWNHPAVECIPECGDPAYNSSKMTTTIRAAQFREFPWNVAVYKKTNKNAPVLFAGVLISPTLVLTNAKCCDKEMIANQSKADMFQVVVGKKSADSDITDDNFQKSFKVKTVHFPDTKPQEAVSSERESIAIVELNEKITMCVAVQPACVNWNKNVSLNPKDGTMGMVPHWRTRDPSNADTVNDVLQTVAMKLQSREVCQRKVHKEFVQFLSKDAFCVELIPMLSPAHRGSGFIYEDTSTKLHYVQGIIYFTGTVNGPIATFINMFLNVSAHVDWMNSIRRKTEKRLHRDVVLNARLVENATDVCSSFDNQTEDTLHSGFDAFDEYEYLANGCELPLKDSLFLDYHVNCLSGERLKKCQFTEQGSLVPEFTSLVLNCSEGYVSTTSKDVVCFRSKWSPPVEPCRKLCDKLQLQSVNVNLKCLWKGKRTDCDGDLKSGTTAVAECAPYYQSVKNLPELVCNENGHWDGLSDIACTYFDPWSEKGEKNTFFNYTAAP